jgi:hypothetical protein
MEQFLYLPEGGLGGIAFGIHTKSGHLRSVQSVNREMDEEFHFPFVI